MRSGCGLFTVGFDATSAANSTASLAQRGEKNWSGLDSIAIEPNYGQPLQSRLPLPAGELGNLVDRR
jgi:hypothetical protein